MAKYARGISKRHAIHNTTALAQRLALPQTTILRNSECRGIYSAAPIPRLLHAPSARKGGLARRPASRTRLAMPLRYILKDSLQQTPFSV